MTEEIKLCDLGDIPDGESAGFTAMVDGQDRLVLAVRKGAAIYAYLNSCPHIGTPLNLDAGFSSDDMQGGKFLSLDKQNIQCSTHGALFRIEDGFCIYGPCQNQSLDPVPVTIRNNTVILCK